MDVICSNCKTPIIVLDLNELYDWGWLIFKFRGKEWITCPQEECQKKTASLIAQDFTAEWQPPAFELSLKSFERMEQRIKEFKEKWLHD